MLIALLFPGKSKRNQGEQRSLQKANTGEMRSSTLPVLCSGSPDPSGVDVTRRDVAGGELCKSAGRGLKAEPSQANKSADGLKAEPLFVEARRLKKPKVRGWGGGGWSHLGQILGAGLGHLFQ